MLSGIFIQRNELFAQKEIIQVKNKLVYTSFRDSRGLIWLGAESGLVLYQNNRFISYNHTNKDTNSVLDGIIYSLAEDESGNIWVVTYTNGITIFNPENNTYKRITVSSHPGLLSDKMAITIKFFDKHTMLLNTSKGAYTIDTRDYSFKAALPQRLNFSEIVIHKKYGNKNYYLIQNRGLLQISNSKANKLFTIPKSEMNFMGLAVIKNKIYVSGFSGVYQLVNDTLKKIYVYYGNKEISKEGINDLIEDNQDIYINSLKYGMIKAIPCKNMFVCSDVDTANWYKAGNLLYSNYYDSITNSFFIGTQQGLFIHKQKKSFFREIINNTEKVGTVRALLIHNNQLYIGTEGGVYILNKKLKKLFENGMIKSAFVNTLFKTKNEMIFASGFHFYRIIYDKLINNQLFSSLISVDENAILSNSLNDSTVFIIANKNKRIIYWNNLNNNYYSDSLPVANDLVPPVLTWGENIILSSYTGMYLYNPRSKSVRKVTSEGNVQITDVKVNNNVIYYSTSTNGIIALDSNFNQIKKINISKLAGASDVRSFVILHNIIWFSSSEGIGYFNLSNNELAYYKSGELFTTTGFLNGSSTINGDTIYFGGDNGIVAVNTKAILDYHDNSKCYLFDVSLYQRGELLKVPDPINHNFQYDQNNIEIQLVSTQNDLSVYNHYSYVLNNNPEIPIDETGKIKLYNLSPDKYHLKVIMRESGEEKASYNFTISPPWYQTWWFRVLLGVIILANGIWISRLYFRRRLIAQQKELEKQLALQSERDRISSDMHDDLGSGLSSIKLISEMLKKKHSDTETKSDLNEIVDHATSLTDTMREMVWSLNPRNDTLSRFVDHIIQYSKQFFEPSEINFKVLATQEFPEISMNGFVRRNLFLCLKEVFNNIIKHAQANNVLCTISYHEHKLIISIQDDGRGIPESYTQGNGLYSIRKRIADCHGHIEWANQNPGLNTIIEILV